MVSCGLTMANQCPQEYRAWNAPTVARRDRARLRKLIFPRCEQIVRTPASHRMTCSARCRQRYWKQRRHEADRLGVDLWAVREGALDSMYESGRAVFPTPMAECYRTVTGARQGGPKPSR